MARHGLGRAFLIRSLPAGLVPEGESPTVEDYGIAARNDVVFAPDAGEALRLWGACNASTDRAFAIVLPTVLV
jgi:hypothetical protein